ncbi:MAG: HAMP domain-containing protein [Desulfohalobiaceae bacterium]|nr:HAMP domain-containing protein [Desulfohalobiaceae bacterium]
MSDRTVKRIQPVSEAAESVSRGEYGQPLPENGPRDEIGRLTRDFNRMVQGLRERDVIRNPKAGSGRKPTFRIEIYLKFEACVLGFLSIIFKSEVQSSCFL